MSQISSVILGTAPGVGPVLTLTGDTGGAVPPTGGGTINVLGGTGVQVTGVPGTSTLTIDVETNAFVWNKVGVPTALVKQNGYFTTAPTTFTLPAVAAVGDTFIVCHLVGAWTIQCGAGQDIIYGANDTSIGGSLVSGASGDSVTLVCSTTNSTFLAIASMGGVITVN